MSELRKFVKKKEIEFLIGNDGNSPFIDWLHSLPSVTSRACLLNACDQVALTHAGINAKLLITSLGHALFEHRVRIPGSDSSTPSGSKVQDKNKSFMASIYFTLCGSNGILIVNASTHTDRSKAIEKARELLKEFKNDAH